MRRPLSMRFLGAAACTVAAAHAFSLPEPFAWLMGVLFLSGAIAGAVSLLEE